MASKSTATNGTKQSPKQQPAAKQKNPLAALISSANKKGKPGVQTPNPIHSLLQSPLVADGYFALIVVWLLVAFLAIKERTWNRQHATGWKTAPVALPVALGKTFSKGRMRR